MGKVKRLCLCAMMVALALALSYAERFIPLQGIIPLPGIKLGLANVVTLVALYLLPTKYAYRILICRCVLGAVFGGGITGFAFSVSGGVLALLTMAAVKKTSLFSIYGVSVFGAAAHNVGQILAAMVLMRSVYVAAYLSYLLPVAILSGLLIGSACAGVLRVLPKVYTCQETEAEG